MRWIAIILVLQLGIVWAELTNVHVSSNAKKNIINIATTDIDAAFELYTKTYPDSSGSGILLSSSSLDEVKKARSKQKKAFKKNIKKMKDHNAKYELGKASYSLTVNSFTVIDAEDRKKYLGILGNTSQSQKYLSAPKLTSDNNLQALPSSFDWKKKGYVTPVKNQGSCGSCWTYGAVGPMEYIYKKVTGNLVPLSEQELLDCTYEGTGQDGCDGGWYHQAWDFVIGRGGTAGSQDSHLSNQKNYGYEGKDGGCSHATHSNALKDILKITGYVKVEANENAVLKAIAFKMPLAVAFKVEDDFYTIGEGVYNGCTSEANPTPNHAVVMTGYGANYFEIKNSWGEDWANNGYARLQRGRNTCGILSFAYYIEFQSLYDGGNSPDDDEGSKVTTTPPPDNYFTTDAQKSDDRPDVDKSTCYDYKDECRAWARMGYCLTHVDYMKAWCKVSCTDCTCKDNSNVDCSRIKRQGHCKNNVYEDYAAANCPITCGHCKPCPAGYYTAPEGCKKCPKGTYSFSGASFCTKCPDGKTSDAGSISVASCKKIGCGPGYYKENGACIACPENSYSEDGDIVCTQCPQGKVTKKVAASSRGDCKDVYTCVDYDNNCWTWAQSGYCISSRWNTYIDYMKLNCKKSCQYCESCDDNDFNCASYAAMGYCQSGSEYYSYMAMNCKKSCEYCDESSDSSSDSNSDSNSDNNKCKSSALVWCDGKCKHIHMCGKN